MISHPEYTPAATPRFELLIDQIKATPELTVAKVLALLDEFGDSIRHIIGSIDGRYSFVVGKDVNRGIELSVDQPSAKGDDAWHTKPGTLTIHIYDTVRAILTLHDGRIIESVSKHCTVLPEDERIVPFANNTEVKTLKRRHTAPDAVDTQGKALLNTEDIVDIQEQR